MNSRLRPLLFAVLLAVAAGGVFGWKWWSARSAAAAERQQLFAAVEAALERGDRDASELSRLVARLRDLDADDHQVRLRLARIQLLRQRYDLAAEQLQYLTFGGGDLVELRTAARAWLGWHATSAADADTVRALLRQCQQFATAAAQGGDTAADHFVVWQAAVRLGDDAAAKQANEVLQQRFAESIEARTAARVADSGDLEQPPGPVEDLCREWGEPPPELALLRAVLLVQRGLDGNDGVAIERAAAALDALLVQASNLVEVRNWAAVAHHLGSHLTTGPEQARHRAVRDEQVGWLLQRAAPDDRRRSQWLQMRGS